MNKRYKGEIDGFWIFIILLFIVVPLGRELIQKLPGGSNDGLGTGTTVEVSAADTAEEMPEAPVAANGKSMLVILDEDGSTHTVNAYDLIKFKVNKDIVRVIIETSDKTKIRAPVKKGYVHFAFHGEGKWDITTYDASETAIGWYKINVY